MCFLLDQEEQVWLLLRRINIKNNKYQNDNTPLDPDCDNLNLNKYSKNYLNHLFNTNEILASIC